MRWDDDRQPVSNYSCAHDDGFLTSVTSEDATSNPSRASSPVTSPVFDDRLPMESSRAYTICHVFSVERSVTPVHSVQPGDLKCTQRPQYPDYMATSDKCTSRLSEPDIGW
jgi:hypothetical protein